MFDRYNIKTKVVPIDNDNDRYNSSRLNVATVATKSESGEWVKYEDVKHLLERSDNSEYVPPTAKSCTGCKHEWAHARCLMCERNFKDEYEGA